MKPVFGPIWNKFAAECVPASPGDVQYEETRKAFYAGANVVMASVNAAGEPNVSETAALALLSQIEDELQAFGKEIDKQIKERKAKPPLVPPVTAKVKRTVGVDRLRCEAEGFSDASCLAVFNILGIFTPTAHELFKVAQTMFDNEQAVAWTLLAMQQVTTAMKRATP